MVVVCANTWQDVKQLEHKPALDADSLPRNVQSTWHVKRASGPNQASALASHAELTDCTIIAHAATHTPAPFAWTIKSGRACGTLGVYGPANKCTLAEALHI